MIPSLLPFLHPCLPWLASPGRALPVLSRFPRRKANDALPPFPFLATSLRLSLSLRQERAAARPSPRRRATLNLLAVAILLSPPCPLYPSLWRRPRRCGREEADNLWLTKTWKATLRGYEQVNIFAPREAPEAEQAREGATESRRGGRLILCEKLCGERYGRCCRGHSA